MEVAESIATRGFFPNEPLLAVKEDGRFVVVEGNRRLAALKALREPSLLEGTYERQVERLARRIVDPNYTKGETLYLNRLDHAYHERLAEQLRSMNDAPWVLTYDDCPEIRGMYADWANGAKRATSCGWR